MLAVLVAACALPAAAATFAVAGATPASIQPTVDAFRAALGPLNPNTAVENPGGRREINWDGVPDALSAPANLPANFFNVNSPRGVVFSTPGTGFQTSARSTSGTPVRFGNVNPAYTAEFQTFSAQQLFRAVGSNIVTIDFFVAGSTTQAAVAGFGAVFTDVELAAQTTISLVLSDGTDGGTFAAPTSVTGGLSFLGITDSRLISRVTIKAGTAALAAGTGDNPGAGIDVVAIDDFIYGEPRRYASLDVDRSVTATKYDPLTDGLLVLRYLFSLTGAALVNNALGTTAARTDSVAIKTYLDLIRPALDVDGNGQAEPLTDGLLILRYLFALRGAALIANAFDPAGARTTAATIEPYIQSLMP